ncbi:MAG: hypothetical protein ACRDRN_17565 [Sciscionella sp.]
MAPRQVVCCGGAARCGGATAVVGVAAAGAVARHGVRGAEVRCGEGFRRCPAAAWDGAVPRGGQREGA